MDGRRRDFGLGSLGNVSLADAREKATELRNQYLNGLDPAIERKKSSQIRMSNPTFEKETMGDDRSRLKHCVGVSVGGCICFPHK